MNTSTRIVVAACALLGLDTLAWAADAPAPASTHAPTWHPTHDRMLHGPMHRVLKELDLTAQQKQQVHDIVDTALTQARNERPDFTVLANPGDPNYAAAIADAKVHAAQRVQEMSDITQQIYAILTPEQKAKLPQVLAEMKTKFEQRHG